MNITIRMPNPTPARKAAVMTALESRTGRTINATIVESPDYDPDRIDVSGTVKGVGPKTWEKWTVIARVAIRRLEKREQYAKDLWEAQRGIPCRYSNAPDITGR
jgi:hypothetical protein